MSDILAAPAIFPIWLTGFALSLGLAGMGLWCLLVRQGRVTKLTWGVWSAASLLPASLSLWDLFHRLDPGFTGTFVLVFETLLLAGVAVGFYLLGARQHTALEPLRQRNAPKSPRPADTRRLSWALVGLNAVVAIWASHRFYECIAVDDAGHLLSLVNWLPEPTQEARAVTDHGSSIGLYKAAANPAAVAPNREALAAAAAKHFLDRRIKRRDATTPSNCHGWVFTGGRYFLSPDDVEKILVENDYRRVTNLTAGDLVIYRDAAGNIVHSGVVRLAEKEFVLVESQWGANARYLHEPEQQVYSSTFEYYRSKRTGHLVRVLDEQNRDL